MAQYTYVHNETAEAHSEENSKFNRETEADMLPISKGKHPKGGRYCILRGCYETRSSYNTMRDHLFFHHQFQKQMISHSEDYKQCCKTPPPFKNDKKQMLHQFKYCENAKKNLENLMSQVWNVTECHIYDDGVTLKSDI